MKLVISFLLIFIHSSAKACSFRNDHTIFSLSGPITYLLKELNLLNKVQGISIFHGLDKSDFAGEFIGGGIFLSPKYIKKHKSVLVFYDESNDLKKNLLNQGVEIIEVKTRNMDPFEALNSSLIALQTQISGCEKKIKEIKEEAQKINNFFKEKTPLKHTYVFFLGELLANKRRPNLVMVDNFVLYFKKLNLIKTYPTSLNYAPWAQKVMNELRKSFVVEVGVSNKNSSELKLSSISSSEINLSQNALLIPGLSQVKVLKSLWEKLEKQDSLARTHL